MKKTTDFNRSTLPFILRLCLISCLALCLALFVGCDDIDDLISLDGDPSADSSEKDTTEPTQSETVFPTELPTDKPEDPTDPPAVDPKPEDPTDPPAAEPDGPICGTLEDPLTPTKVLDANSKLENGEFSEEKFYVKGEVQSIGATGSYYKEVYISDGENEFLIYTINMPDGITGFKVGDTITACGYIKNYNGLIEMATKYIDEVANYAFCVKVEEAPVAPEDPVEPPFVDVATIDVYTAEELLTVVSKLNNGEILSNVTINLRADIDLQDIPFTPIYEFRGTFNGHGYKISNIDLTLDGATIVLSDGNWIDYTVTAIGFFGSAYDATIFNLVLENVSANFETDREIFVGALVGYAVGVEVDSCSVSTNMNVTVSHPNVGSHSISGVAGLIGYSLDAYVQHTTVTCNIDYSANSYEAFTGTMLGVGNMRIYSCLMYLDISFVGTMYGHTGSVIGMERTPDGVTLANMYDSIVSGKLYIDNPRGYDWGEIGQGYFYLSDTGDIQHVEEYNKINVQKTTA